MKFFYIETRNGIAAPGFHFINFNFQFRLHSLSFHILFFSAKRWLSILHLVVQSCLLVFTFTSYLSHFFSHFYIFLPIHLSSLMHFPPLSTCSHLCLFPQYSLTLTYASYFLAIHLIFFLLYSMCFSQLPPPSFI
jgi:hypothetical protein